MFENVDGRRTDDGRTTDGRRTDDGVTGILIAHLGAFGSGELKIGFQDRLSLNAGHKYCRMSILQYFLPSLSYHLSLRPLFCLF